jgi:hypothetical protein
VLIIYQKANQIRSVIVCRVKHDINRQIHSAVEYFPDKLSCPRSHHNSIVRKHLEKHAINMALTVKLADELLTCDDSLAKMCEMQIALLPSG